MNNTTKEIALLQKKINDEQKTLDSERQASIEDITLIANQKINNNALAISLAEAETAVRATPNDKILNQNVIDLGKKIAT